MRKTVYNLRSLGFPDYALIGGADGRMEVYRLVKPRFPSRSRCAHVNMTDARGKHRQVGLAKLQREALATEKLDETETNS